VANKGGVGGEGTTGRLLAMAREMGGSLVRTAALDRLDRGRETRAGRTSAREERGKLGGLAEGH
jgi:hypothetical protein